MCDIQWHAAELNIFTEGKKQTNLVYNELWREMKNISL